MSFTKSLMLGVTAAALLTSGAQAADLLMPANQIYDSALFDFEGFYVGATAGLGAFPGPGGNGMLGVVVGANFAVTDAFLTGVEFQGDTVWNGAGFYGLNALFLGKVGGYLSDDMIVYGTLGGGWLTGTPSYGIGAGVEMAIADQFSVRGEAMATGSWGGGFNGGKITAGLLWHLD
jgi:outer membrane immunogenic protein